MKGLVLHLESATQYERIERVESFIGEDASGSFGILPGHARLVTVLEFGLARYRVAGASWEYLAAPGAVVYCVDGDLHFSTRRYLRGRDYEQVYRALRAELREEEEALSALKRQLQRLEQELFRRLWQLGRDAEVAR